MMNSLWVTLLFRNFDHMFRLSNKLSWLEARQNRRLCLLEESYQHEIQTIRAKETLRRSNDSNLLCPYFQENTHYVKPLVNFTVSIDKIWIVETKNIIYIEININSCFLFFELKNGDFLSRNNFDISIQSNLR